MIFHKYWDSPLDPSTSSRLRQPVLRSSQSEARGFAGQVGANGFLICLDRAGFILESLKIFCRWIFELILHAGRLRQAQQFKRGAKCLVQLRKQCQARTALRDIAQIKHFVFVVIRVENLCKFKSVVR